MTLLQAMLELNRLDASIAEKRAALAERNCITESVVNEDKDFQVDVSEELESVRKIWTDLLGLVDQRSKLHQNITVANSRLGLDVLLSKRNAVRNNIKMFSGFSMRGYGRMSSKPRSTHTPYSADKNAYWKHDIMTVAVPQEEIDEHVTLLKNELQELEVKIAELNNQPL